MKRKTGDQRDESGYRRSRYGNDRRQERAGPDDIRTTPKKHQQQQRYHRRYQQPPGNANPAKWRTIQFLADHALLRRLDDPGVAHRLLAHRIVGVRRPVGVGAGDDAAGALVDRAGRQLYLSMQSSTGQTLTQRLQPTHSLSITSK